MRIKTITIQKSKTIEVAGILGKDAYRKITIGAEAELNEGDDEIKSKQTLNDFVDMAIADEVAAMNEEVAAKKKALGIS